MHLQEHKLIKVNSQKELKQILSFSLFFVF